MTPHRHYHWLAVTVLALLLATLLLDRVIPASTSMKLLGWEQQAKQIQVRALWSWIIMMGALLPPRKNDSRWIVCRLLGKIPIFLRLILVWLTVLYPFYYSEHRFWETAAYVHLRNETQMVIPSQIDVDFFLVVPSRFPGRIYYDVRDGGNREALLVALKKVGLEPVQ